MNKNKIKGIIFDLDGVIADLKDIHFIALNQALESDYKITYDEHLSVYDGLPTIDKLNILSSKKGLQFEKFNEIKNNKQKYTLELIKDFQIPVNVIDTLYKLKNDSYVITLCSNSSRETIDLLLHNNNIVDLFNYVISNETIKKNKPSSFPYIASLLQMELEPDEVIIVEDSPKGLISASRICNNILQVNSSKDINYNNIIEFINNIKIYKYKSTEHISILIPMAGAGNRFAQAGYTDPKPLINVNGKYMIQHVVDNLNVNSNYIFLVQKSHNAAYNLNRILPLITNNNTTVINVNGVTEGAAITALLAKSHINNDNPLLICNSDQYIEWDSLTFYYKMRNLDIDGCILYFNDNNPKWSFIKIENDLVVEVAEKKVISNNASVGIYYFKKGSDFVKYAEQMIDKNIRVNNEFYICPVFNEMIQDKKRILPYKVDKMNGLGTPEDLEIFLKDSK